MSGIGMYPDDIVIVHRGGVRRVVRWKSWVSGNAKGAGRSQVYFELGELNGVAVFSLTDGWGIKKLSDWHIADDDHEALVEWAHSVHRRKIIRTPRSMGLKKIFRQGTKTQKEQLSFLPKMKS